MEVDFRELTTPLEEILDNKLRFEESLPGGLSRELQKLGFTDYEAKIYVQLLRTNPVTAYEVSKSCGVPRANAYHALESLARKEAVQPVSEEPVRFVPVPPEVLLEGIASSTHRLCDRLAADLGALGRPEGAHYVWTISGEPAVDGRITQMLRGAQSSVWIKAPAAALRRHEAVLREMAQCGLDILVILFGDSASEFRYAQNVRVFLHESNGRTTGTADNLFTITVDHEELLTANVAGEVYASYTRNHPIVVTAESLIRHDYYLAEIMARFGNKIDEAFGPHLQRLREACFTPAQLERFRKQVNLVGMTE